MSTRTITASAQELWALKEKLKDAEVRKTPPYAHYQLKTTDCVITAYTSGKIVFQGEGADLYADALSSSDDRPVAAALKKEYPQCGSDEVGTGDYFGPVVVCAAHVAQKDVPWLKELGIQDSKAMDDAKIHRLGEMLRSRLTHSLLILNNDTYNRVHPYHHMVAIKAKLHNQAFVHLRGKLHTLPELCIIDQFVQKSSYYRYLQKEAEVVYDIHFETKAENKYLSVACASVIARYAFLLAFDAMEKRYDFSFLKGAGAKVDDNIRAFVKRYGKEELVHVAKLHFANTKKAGILLP